MRNIRQERYDYLYNLSEKEEDTDEQDTERIQLYYELHPEDQHWRGHSPTTEPKDIWGVDTSCYDR